MLKFLKDIENLYAERGNLAYGEDVTQLEHALQCALNAEKMGAPPSLVAAALLHDIGHLFVSEADAVRRDDRHETSGARALSGLFGPEVCAPIALHVAAKRYLCFAEPGYYATLSAASKASLMLQGNAFSSAAAASFEKRHWWREAVLLRRVDDIGKTDERSPRVFADYIPLLKKLATA